MTTKKPEIAAYMSPIYGEVVSQQDYASWEHEASRNPDTEYGEYYKSKTLEYSEPLVCLKDYETLQADRDQQYQMKVIARKRRDEVTTKLSALQAECEKLRKASSELANWCVHGVGADVELTPGLQQVMSITEWRLVCQSLKHPRALRDT